MAAIEGAFPTSDVFWCSRDVVRQTLGKPDRCENGEDIYEMASGPRVTIDYQADKAWRIAVTHDVIAVDHEPVNHWMGQNAVTNPFGERLVNSFASGTTMVFADQATWVKRQFDAAPE